MSLWLWLGLGFLGGWYFGCKKPGSWKAFFDWLDQGLKKLREKAKKQDNKPRF